MEHQILQKEKCLVQREQQLKQEELTLQKEIDAQQHQQKHTAINVNVNEELSNQLNMAQSQLIQQHDLILGNLNKKCNHIQQSFNGISQIQQIICKSKYYQNSNNIFQVQEIQSPNNTPEYAQRDIKNKLQDNLNDEVLKGIDKKLKKIINHYQNIYQQNNVKEMQYNQIDSRKTNIYNIIETSPKLEKFLQLIQNIIYQQQFNLIQGYDFKQLINSWDKKNCQIQERISNLQEKIQDIKIKNQNLVNQQTNQKNNYNKAIIQKNKLFTSFQIPKSLSTNSIKQKLKKNFNIENDLKNFVDNFIDIDYEDEKRICWDEDQFCSYQIKNNSENIILQEQPMLETAKNMHDIVDIQMQSINSLISKMFTINSKTNCYNIIFSQVNQLRQRLKHCNKEKVKYHMKQQNSEFYSVVHKQNKQLIQDNRTSKNVNIRQPNEIIKNRTFQQLSNQNILHRSASLQFGKECIIKQKPSFYE